ncbi:hypothetical protein TNCV_3748911 [Trichonephila clavipes]|nr:hypothetical protein TNCV_3748911 [Trichonephila clavipes]
MKCANCSDAHATNWSRCPKHPSNAKKKNRNSKNNKNGPKPKNNKNTTPQVPPPDISKAKKVTPNLDYSNVIQNKIPQEHISPPSKDVSINAGLLKDLIILIEDTQCVDKQVFCRAFKNSLSALRTASTDVNKTYVIFEAYCRLRSSQA